MKAKLALLLFLFLGKSIFSAPYTGWEIGNNHSILYINDINSFDTRDNIRYLPQKLTPDQINQYALFVSEYYITRGDKDGLTNLVSLLKNDKSNYDSIANLILVLWKIEKGETVDATAKLDEFIHKDDGSLLSTIAKVLKANIKKNCTLIRNQRGN
jgi:hypothetical protein